MSDDSSSAVLAVWCREVLGPCQAPALRLRPDARSATAAVRAGDGVIAYLKVHAQRSFWQAERRAYERWAPAFGGRAPRLLAAREGEPMALLISALPGRPMRDAGLSPAQEVVVWREAGAALAALHAVDAGERFGPPGSDDLSDAVDYVLADLDRWVALGRRAGSLTDEDLAVVDAARALAPAFSGQRPTACHRDYNPYNWLVDDRGHWAGVIDFEFCYPDVRTAEFTRYPEWEWLHRPKLVAALREGYASPPLDGRQMLLSHVIYAVSMIVWGQEHGYLGSAREGREALRYWGRQL